MSPNENEESSSDNTESEGESSSSNYTPEPESIKTTGKGRKIHALLKYSNYTILIFGFLTSQCANNSNFQVDIYKQISFFKAQLGHIQKINKLSNGTYNELSPMSLQANLSLNDVLYYG